jgi:hypothetical protein
VPSDRFARVLLDARARSRRLALFPRKAEIRARLKALRGKRAARRRTARRSFAGAALCAEWHPGCTFLLAKGGVVKRTLLPGALLCAAFLAFGAATALPAATTVSISFFHETLSPHGRWVAAAPYGEVWVPAASVGWEPYVNGEWQYTDWGWTWVSYDPWGDIPFHYGTWVRVSRWGWAWVPGTVWAPAWVTWACTDDFIGWAPVPPSFVLTASGYSGRAIVAAQSAYVFVPAHQFVGVRVNSARVPIARNATILTHASRATAFQVSGGVVHNVGFTPQRIERSVGRRIERTSVDRSRVQPATLAESGHAKSSRVAVVAPASERKRAVESARTKAVHASRTERAPKARAESPKAAARAPEREHAAAPASRPSTAVAEKHATEKRAPAHETAGRHRSENPPAPAVAPKPHPAETHKAPETHAERVKPAPHSSSAAPKPHPAPKPKPAQSRPHPSPKQPDHSSPPPQEKGSDQNHGGVS